jgi:hypothetical protein
LATGAAFRIGSVTLPRAGAYAPTRVLEATQLCERELTPCTGRGTQTSRCVRIRSRVARVAAVASYEQRRRCSAACVGAIERDCLEHGSEHMIRRHTVLAAIAAGVNARLGVT